MAKKKKQSQGPVQALVLPPQEVLDAREEPKAPSGFWCDSCHGKFPMAFQHEKAPGVWLCAACYKFVDREHSPKAISTPTNAERV